MTVMKRMRLQATGLLLALAVLAALCRASPPPKRIDDSARAKAARTAEGSKPNIIVFFADDLGYGDLSYTGHPTILTPNLDSLANEGLRFTQWYSSFHVCSPSRSSMMTGRLPIRTGVIGSIWTGGVFTNIARGGLPLNETTMAELLKPAGYAAAMFGKWHLGQREEYLPHNRGFDEYLGIPYSVDMGTSAWFPQRLDVPLPLMHNSDVVEQPVNLNNLTTRYAQFAKEFIHNATSAEKPFFLYAAFNHVHVPDFASPQFCNTSRRGVYGDAVEEMDSLVGDVYGVIRDLNLERDTITFFTSDNGPWLIMQTAGGSAGLFKEGKQTTWEGGVRVPAFVHWPGKIEQGISQEVSTTYDIFPTVAKLAGVSLPSDRIIDGKDLSSVLFLKGKSPHDCIFIYKGPPGLACPAGHPNCPGLWATRCGAYKLHYVTSEYQTQAIGQFHDPPLLFNIEEDPREWYPINPNSTEYLEARTYIDARISIHKDTLSDVPNQIARGGSHDYAVCGCPQSQAQFPTYPNCTCNPENYHVHACSSVIKATHDVVDATGISGFPDVVMFPDA